MPLPLIAAMPNDVVMAAGYVVRVVAISPTNGATVAGVRLTDVAFQVRPFPAGGGIEDGGALPMPLLVPSSDVVGAPTATPTPTPAPSPSVFSGPLHTQAASVTDLAVKTFDLAVADNLEPTSSPTVTLPAGTRPFHTLANAIVDVAVHLWAVAVADRLEP